MAEHTKYILKVTAGRDYDAKNQQEVHVNTSKPVQISTEHIEASIHVRIKDYRGLPKDSPSTSPYFSHAAHPADRYSLAYSFRLKKDIPGDKLVFGNDFDHPIRDRLPWGFGTAFNWVKGWVDPTMEGDVYADEPYLYSPVLSSMNILQIGGKGQTPTEVAEGSGEKTGDGDAAAIVFTEGAQGDGDKIRQDSGIPADGPTRMKHFRQEQPRKDFVFEKDRAYACDFFNPYLDFNEFALRLPIITIPIIKYWDGQPLRYVLKNLETNEPLFVILFTLIPAENSESSSELGNEEDTTEKGKTSGSQSANDDID